MSVRKIAFAGDLHKRSRDITTIEGYVQCNIAVQRALMQMLTDLEVDTFISLGDWYDKGYINDVSASLADYDLDIQMSAQLKGNFYGLIGNHIRLAMDSNPELHIIQPHPEYKSRRAVARTEQIMKTPDILRLNDVQISFMHHRMNVNDCLAYKPTRQPWAKYHIALFHTPYIVPNSKLLDTNYGYNSSPNSKIGETLAGVDLAIVGDIHNAIGPFQVSTPTGVMTMIVPGSLTNVDAGENSRHTSINIPIVTIDDDSNVTLQYQPFDLKTNLVTFKKKNIEESREKLKSLRGKPVKELYSAKDMVAMIENRDEAMMSLNAFMRAQGYTEQDRRLVKMVIDNPRDIQAVILEYIKGGVAGKDISSV